MVKTKLKTVVVIDIAAIPFADDFFCPGAPAGVLISPEADGPSPEGPIPEPDGEFADGEPDGEREVESPGAIDGDTAGDDDSGAIGPGSDVIGADDGGTVEEDLGAIGAGGEVIGAEDGETGEEDLGGAGGEVEDLGAIDPGGEVVGETGEPDLGAIDPGGEVVGETGEEDLGEWAPPGGVVDPGGEPPGDRVLGEMTTTVSFCPFLQLSSLPLMK